MGSKLNAFEEAKLGETCHASEWERRGTLANVEPGGVIYLRTRILRAAYEVELSLI